MKKRIYTLLVVAPSDLVIAYDTEELLFSHAMDEAFARFGDSVEIISMEIVKPGHRPVVDVVDFLRNNGRRATKADVEEMFAKAVLNDYFFADESVEQQAA